MLEILCRHYAGQKPGPGDTALYRTRWRECLNDTVTLLAGMFFTFSMNYLEGAAYQLKLLRRIFSQLRQPTAAVRAAFFRRQQAVYFTRE